MTRYAYLFSKPVSSILYKGTSYGLSVYEKAFPIHDDGDLPQNNRANRNTCDQAKFLFEKETKRQSMLGVSDPCVKDKSVIYKDLSSHIWIEDTEFPGISCGFYSSQKSKNGESLVVVPVTHRHIDLVENGKRILRTITYKSFHPGEIEIEKTREVFI